MIELTLEDLATPESMEVAEKKILVDVINGANRNADMDRAKVHELGSFQFELLKSCANSHRQVDDHNHNEDDDAVENPISPGAG